MSDSLSSSEKRERVGEEFHLVFSLAHSCGWNHVCHITLEEGTLTFTMPLEQQGDQYVQGRFLARIKRMEYSGSLYDPKRGVWLCLFCKQELAPFPMGGVG